MLENPNIYGNKIVKGSVGNINNIHFENNDFQEIKKGVIKLLNIHLSVRLWDGGIPSGSRQPERFIHRLSFFRTVFIKLFSVVFVYTEKETEYYEPFYLFAELMTILDASIATGVGFGPCSNLLPNCLPTELITTW